MNLDRVVFRFDFRGNMLICGSIAGKVEIANEDFFSIDECKFRKFLKFGSGVLPQRSIF